MEKLFENAKKNTTRRRVLVIAAHPDDEVLGCGGTMAKHALTGDSLWTLVLGQGVTSRKELTRAQAAKTLAELKACTKKANERLGVSMLIMKNFPDNRFDTVALLDIIHEIERVIEMFKPDIVYTHHADDVNIDHQRTYEAVQAAIRPMPSCSVTQAFAFEVASSTEWNMNKKDAFCPNVFYAMTPEYLQEKCNALADYKSEIRSFPHPRSPEYIQALATMRGGQSGFLLAEAFEIIYWRK